MKGVLNSLLITLVSLYNLMIFQHRRVSQHKKQNESLWYESNSNQNRDVLLMIIKSQKHLTQSQSENLWICLCSNLPILIGNEIGSMNTVCHSVEFGLRAIGVWPNTSYAILRQVLCISSMAVFQTFQYRYLIMHFEEKNLFTLMDVLSETVAYSLVLIKLIIFAFNARLLSEVIAHIVEDWKGRDVSEEYTMTRIAYVSRRLSNLIITIYAMSVFFYATSTVLKYESTNQTDTRELILKMELPFEMKSTAVYTAVLVIQFIHQTSAISTESMFNSLLITLVLHTCGQIDIIQQKLNEITQTNIERGIMKTLIIRHQKIISFSKNIEGIFSNIALVQFVSNTLVICCLGFLIVVSIGIPNGTTVLVKSMLFYIAINIDVFIFCFAGEYLSTKSRLIGDAAYNSLWYDSNLNQHRNVLLMIMTSQKHLQLTAGKFVDLSLQQFTNIVKASASYVSVLHAMY